MNAEPNESMDKPTRDEMTFVLAQRFDAEIDIIMDIANVSYPFAHGIAAGMRIARERMNRARLIERRADEPGFQVNPNNYDQ